jgi:hypothetical protein
VPLEQLVRDAPPVNDQPRVKPLAWRIVGTQEGMLLALVVTPEGSLRVTSPISEIRAATRTVVTASGRVYELEIPPALDEPMRGLLLALAARFGLGSAIDASASVWERFEAATQ